MSDLERFQQKRQQNLNFINELIQNHKINFEDEKQMNRTVSPRQQSISSSNMTDQIIAIFNHRQKESIKSPPKTLQESGQFSSTHSLNETKEADGIINEIDNVLDRIKNKYNINYSLNDLKEQMNIQLEDQTADNSQEIFNQQLEQFFPLRKKNDFIYIKEELNLNLNQKPGLPPTSTKLSQAKKALPKRVEMIEKQLNEEQIQFENKEYQSPQFHTAEFFFNQQENKQQQNQKFKQQLHQLKKTFKDIRPKQEEKPSLQDYSQEIIEPYVEQIDDSQSKITLKKLNYENQEKIIEKKLTYIEEDQQYDSLTQQNEKSYLKTIEHLEKEIDFQSFQTPQKQNLEYESNLSYSQSAISDRYISISKVKSSQISLEEAIRTDKILQQLVDEEILLFKELDQLKLKLNKLEQN